MSFSDEVRSELLTSPFRNKCCRRAFALGLLLGAELNRDGDIQIVFSSRDAADFCLPLIKQQFGRDPELKEITRGGRPAFKVTFNSDAAAGLLNKYSGLSDGGIPEIAGFRCEYDAGVFTRGVFCAVGTVSDPNRFYHLEFHLPDIRRAEKLSDLLSQNDFQAGIAPLKNGYRLYFKKSESIEMMMAFIGAQNAYFGMSDIKFINELRANENRATNCVASNIKKSVSASARQVAAIKKLMESPVFLTLPDDMRETADLRVNNSEMSLSELAAAHTEPITKSGLNHRLLKLMAMAEEL